MDLDDPVAVALAVADALRQEAIPYALYGGLLLAACGEARETKDGDVAVVRADAPSVAPLLEAEIETLSRSLPTHPIADRWQAAGFE